MNLNQIVSRLKEGGYRMTQQRKMLIELLYHNRNSFLSCEEIENYLKPKNSSINLSTIYRNMLALENYGIVCRYNGDSNSCLYKLSSHSHHHHHITCIKCHKTESFDYCPIEEFNKISERSGFELLDHSIELIGICEKCKKRD